MLFFVNNIVALFLTPYMLQFISQEEYGLYILCVDFLTLVSFLEFGTNKVIESKAGHQIAQGDMKGLNISFNSSFYFQVLVGIAVIPLFYLLVYSGLEGNQMKYLHLVILLFSISAGISVFRSLFSSVIIASRKVHLDNRIQLFINIFNYSLILLLTPFVGVIGLAIINVVAVILMVVRSKIRIGKLFPELKINRAYFQKDELKNLLSSGIFFSLGSIATVLLVKIDSYIIGREFGLAEVASFFITVKVFVLAQKVFQMFLNNFRPHMAQLYGKKDFEKIKTFYEISMPLLLGAGAISISIVMLINTYFVEWWVGKKFFLSYSFSVFFGFWIFLDLMTLPSRIILTASLYNLRDQSYARLMESVGRLLLIFFFLQSLGLDIMPISSVLSCFVFGNLFFLFQTKRFFHQQNFSLKILPILFQLGLIILLFGHYQTVTMEYFPYTFGAIGLVIFGVYLYLNARKLKELGFLLQTK